MWLAVQWRGLAGHAEGAICARGLDSACCAVERIGRSCCGCYLGSGARFSLLCGGEDGQAMLRVLFVLMDLIWPTVLWS